MSSNEQELNSLKVISNEGKPQKVFYFHILQE